jgi:G3E family GTPase
LQTIGGECGSGIVVNDFGVPNTDSDLIRVTTSTTIALSNGCICCSMQDDLAAAVIELCRSHTTFIRLIIECSGVSYPARLPAIFESPLISKLALFLLPRRWLLARVGFVLV